MFHGNTYLLRWYFFSACYCFGLLACVSRLPLVKCIIHGETISKRTHVCCTTVFASSSALLYVRTSLDVMFPLGGKSHEIAMANRTAKTMSFFGPDGMKSRAAAILWASSRCRHDRRCCRRLPYSRFLFRQCYSTKHHSDLIADCHNILWPISCAAQSKSSSQCTVKKSVNTNQKQQTSRATVNVL